MTPHILSGETARFASVKGYECFRIPDRFIHVDQVMQAVSAVMDSMQVLDIAIQLRAPCFCFCQAFSIL